MGRIDFQHDKMNDVVIATPHWKIETEADVIAWYEEYAAYFTRLGRRVDFVVVLDDFSIEPAIGSLWGEYRAKIHKDFTRLSYRVHASKRVKLFVDTSGVRYSAGRDEAASIEDAIAAILEARKAP